MRVRPRRGGVFPRIDEEAIEAAKGGKEESWEQERQAEAGSSGDRWNKGRSREEEADCKFFRETVRAAGGMDEDEVAGKEAAFDEVEADGLGRKCREQDREAEGSGGDPDQKSTAMMMMEAVTLFKLLAAEGSCVEKPVGSVEQPDGKRHGRDGGRGEMDLVDAGDKPGPERGHGWRIE